MAENKGTPRGPGGAKAAAAGTGGFRLAGFPKEFERNVWEALDKRFYITLLSSWVFSFGIALILGSRDYESLALQQKIRDIYLEKFYEAAIVEPVVADIEEATGPGMGEEIEAEKAEDTRAERDKGKAQEVRGQSAAERRAARAAAAAARSRARAQMESEVAGTGILGVLSAGGGAGTGDAVVDVLGDVGGGTGDLASILGSVGGLATAASAGQRSRLGSRGTGRTSGSADVNDLIEGIGSVGSSTIGRKGSIKLALGSARVSGRGSKATYRSGDEISRGINSHNDAIEACYKRESKLNPNLKGEITVEFTIGYNGRVKGQRILQSSLKNKKVENCMLKRIKSWRFKPIGKKEGDVKVRQKYIFG